MNVMLRGIHTARLLPKTSEILCSLVVNNIVLTHMGKKQKRFGALWSCRVEIIDVTEQS